MEYFSYHCLNGLWIILLPYWIANFRTLDLKSLLIGDSRNRGVGDPLLVMGNIEGTKFWLGKPPISVCCSFCLYPFFLASSVWAWDCPHNSPDQNPLSVQWNRKNSQKWKRRPEQQGDIWLWEFASGRIVPLHRSSPWATG